MSKNVETSHPLQVIKDSFRVRWCLAAGRVPSSDRRNHFHTHWYLFIWILALSWNTFLLIEQIFQDSDRPGFCNIYKLHRFASFPNLVLFFVDWRVFSNYEHKNTQMHVMHIFLLFIIFVTQYPDITSVRKKTENLDKSSKTIDVLLVFFERSPTNIPISLSSRMLQDYGTIDDPPIEPMELDKLLSNVRGASPLS